MAITPEPEGSPEQRRFSAEVIEMPNSAEVAEGISTERPATTIERVEEVATQAALAAGEAVHRAGQAAAQSTSEAAKAVAQSTSEAVHQASETASRIYRDAQARAREGYAQASETTQELLRLTWSSAKMAKRDYPLQTLAALAGVAFLVGITLRILKSRRS